MGSLGELSLGDIARALGRYKPVAVTVLAILVALAVLPKPDRPPGLASTGTGAGISTPSAAAPASASGATTDVAADGGVADESFSPPVTSGTTSFPSFSAGSSFSAGTSSDSGSSDVPSGSSSDDSSTSTFGPITSGTSTVDTTGAPEAPKPLQVVAAGWASRTGGTPLAKDGVPAGTLPVGSRATQPDKISYVRLAGDGTSLGFATDPAGNRAVSGPPKIQACKITETWSEAEGIALQDAPTHSETKCVQGTLAASGIWVFDLSSFADRADELGFALVPGEGAGVDWQVAFKR